MPTNTFAPSDRPSRAGQSQRLSGAMSSGSKNGSALGSKKKCPLRTVTHFIHETRISRHRVRWKSLPLRRCAYAPPNAGTSTYKPVCVHLSSTVIPCKAVHADGLLVTIIGPCCRGVVVDTGIARVIQPPTSTFRPWSGKHRDAKPYTQCARFQRCLDLDGKRPVLRAEQKLRAHWNGVLR
jgi:hypothetical protein